MEFLRDGDELVVHCLDGSGDPPADRYMLDHAGGQVSIPS